MGKILNVGCNFVSGRVELGHSQPIRVYKLNFVNLFSQTI